MQNAIKPQTKKMKVSLDTFETNPVRHAEKEYDEKHFLQFTKNPPR